MTTARSTHNILAVCCTGHGAGLAVVTRDHGVRAMTLERFTGERHALLLSRRELDHVRAHHDPLGIWRLFPLCYGRFPPAFAFEDTIAPWTDALLSDLPLTRGDIDVVTGPRDQFALDAALIGRLRRWFPAAEVRLEAEHHQAHAFQAFLPSPFAEAAVLTADACGEALARLDGRKLAMTLGVARRPAAFEVVAEHPFPGSSPGWFYGHVTLHLGFFIGDEGKTMGLAPHGSDRLAAELRGHVELRDDGSWGFVPDFSLDEWLARCVPKRARGAPLDGRHADVAFATQAVLEDILINAVAALGRCTRSPNLCLAGGVALNSVANQKAFARSRFARIYVCPNAGDTGQALGCALALAARAGLGPGEAGLPHDYLGPVYADARARAAIEGAGLTARRCDDEDSRADAIAAWIADGKIVAHYWGGSEHGPRALGHRSILADPRRADMPDHLNHRVKHREAFRPFAPAVLAEAGPQWFAGDDLCPFMLRVVDVCADRRAEIPAVTHVDGTARVQSVRRDDAPALHAILRAFERRTGVPLVLNTSLNVAGRPIVETPEDALACFASTRIDALALGPWLIETDRAADA